MFNKIKSKKINFDIYVPKTNLPEKKPDILFKTDSVWPKRFVLNIYWIKASIQINEIKEIKIKEKIFVKFFVCSII